MHVIFDHDLGTVGEMLEPHRQRKGRDDRGERARIIGKNFFVASTKCRTEGEDEERDQYQQGRRAQRHVPVMLRSRFSGAKALGPFAVSQIAHVQFLRR